MPDVILYSFTITFCFFTGMLGIIYMPLNRKGNFWFGIFLFSLALAILSKMMESKGYDRDYTAVVPFAELSRLIIAPTFYFAGLTPSAYMKAKKVSVCTPSDDRKGD